MRTYEMTHPWLKFDLELRQATPKLWTVLGKAQSECEHISGIPLRPTTASDVELRCFAKGVAATAAIGGNTLTEQEVLQQLLGELKLPASRQHLGQETANIVKACQQIVESVPTSEPVELSAGKIKSLNRMVLANVPVGPKVIPGEIRKHQVSGPGYEGAPAADCEFLLDRLLQWLNGECFASPEGLKTVCGLLKATAAHIYIALIQPFGDGNGRTARLVEFQILLEVGVPTVAANLLNSHYNQTRQEYYRQLQQAVQLGGNVLPFIEYAVEGLTDGLKTQLRYVRDEQWNVTWRNHIDELFAGKTDRPAVRRRHLALGLSLVDGWVPVSEVRHVSARVAADYAGKTQKCISRDLEMMDEMGIVERKRGAVRARRERTLAFLPTPPRAEQTNNPG